MRVPSSACSPPSLLRWVQEDTTCSGLYSDTAPRPRKSCKELKREQMKEDGKIKESLQEEDPAQQTMERLLRGGGTPQRGTDSGARRLKKLSAALSQPRGYEKNYVGDDLNLS